MEIILTKPEETVCRILHYAMNERHGVCDPTDFDQLDEEILEKFQKNGYLHTDVNCIILHKDFKEFLNNKFGGRNNGF